MASSSSLLLRRPISIFYIEKVDHGSKLWELAIQNSFSDCPIIKTQKHRGTHLPNLTKLWNLIIKVGIVVKYTKFTLFASVFYIENEKPKAIYFW